MRERAGWLVRLLGPENVARWRAAQTIVAPFLAGALASAIPGWRLVARRRWCTEQRGRLLRIDPRVVWVRDGDKVPWAFWGAEQGFFELEWADHLPYLRAAATQA